MHTTGAANDAQAAEPEAVARLAEEVAALRAEVARLEARLAEAEGLADRDALTPALNRRALMRELARAIALQARHGDPASLVYFDVDGLKTINDRFGHAAGDAALKAVAERLGREIRQSDAIGRLGGDEFAVILLRTDGDAARAKAAALAAAVAGRPLRFAGGSTALKLSWGVAELRAGAEPEAIVAEADQAMYARKRAGRTFQPR